MESNRNDMTVFLELVDGRCDPDVDMFQATAPFRTARA